MLRKILLCPKNFFRPVKWYTDQKFFSDGGGEVVRKNYFRKKIFAVRPPHFLGWIDALGLVGSTSAGVLSMTPLLAQLVQLSMLNCRDLRLTTVQQAGTT